MIQSFAHGEVDDADFQDWVETQTYKEIHAAVLEIIDALDETDAISLGVKLRCSFFSREFAIAIMMSGILAGLPRHRIRVARPAQSSPETAM